MKQYISKVNVPLLQKIIILALFVVTFSSEAQQLKQKLNAKNVTGISYSADNQHFFVSSSNSIKQFTSGTNTITNEFIDNFQNNEQSPVQITDFTVGDNSRLIYCGTDKKIKVREMPVGHIIYEYGGFASKIIAVRFADNGQLVISAFEDGTVKAENLQEKRELYSRKDFNKSLRVLEVSNDGRFFAAAGGDKTILIYEAATGTIVHKLSGHNDWVRSLTFSPNGETLASGGDDKRILLWDLKSGTTRLEIAQTGWIYDLEFTHDGKYIAAGLEKSAIHFYNSSNGALALNIKDFKAPVIKIAISPGGKEVASLEGYGSDVKLWNIESLNIAPLMQFKDASDIAPPLIMVSNPSNVIDNRVIVYQDLLDIRGLVTDDAGVRSLKVNGMETPIRAAGNFVVNMPLSMGDNLINLEATDVNGNIAIKRFTVVRKNMEGEAYIGREAVNHLFVVGINNYRHWPKLNNAVKDANDLVSVLMSRYTFEFSNVTVIRDEQATRTNIYNSLRSLIEKTGPGDNVVVYFSGHGYFDTVLNEGYWIPVEANTQSTGEYISNSDILKILGSINSQHTFLVADACFSGALFSDSRRGYTEQVEKYRSRWGLASGRLETVSDGQPGTNSPFATQLLYFLQTNQKEKFAVSELIQFVKTQVAEYSDQTPIGNPLKALGDEGGEMVFYKKTN